MNSRRCKIGLLGLEDPTDIRSYSGTPHYLYKALQAAGHEVCPLGPFPVKYRALINAANKILRRTQHQHIVWERHSLISRQYPKIIERYEAANTGIDLLLATSAYYIAGAKTRVPLAFWGDTTVAGVIGKYPYYSHISRRMIRQSHKVEQDALDSCDLAIFSNKWAAEVALDNYRVDPLKVHVLTYGANLSESPDEHDVERLIASRRETPITLLLVGVDWKRKGVDIAIATTETLLKCGIDCRLQIVGCNAPKGYVPRPFVEVKGRISKTDPKEAPIFKELLGQAHIFILPSQAECAAVSLAEANAFGLPVVASEVGGNNSLVKQGVNGFLVSPSASPEEWASVVKTIVSQRNHYEEFAARAFRYYVAELSWSVAVQRFNCLLAETILAAKTSGQQRRTCSLTA